MCRRDWCCRAGLQSLVVTLACAAVLGATTDKLAWAHANFVPLLTASTAFSFAMSVALYASSFAGGKMLAASSGQAGGGDSHPIYEFFMGRELNPRIGSFDLKEFCELYPGLVGEPLAACTALPHHVFPALVPQTAAGAASQYTSSCTLILLPSAPTRCADLTAAVYRRRLGGARPGHAAGAAPGHRQRQRLHSAGGGLPVAVRHRCAVVRGRDPDHHGHHLGWLRLHAGVR